MLNYFILSHKNMKIKIGRNILPLINDKKYSLKDILSSWLTIYNSTDRRSNEIFTSFSSNIWIEMRDPVACTFSNLAGFKLLT